MGGIANVYLSEYQSSQQSFFKGDSLAELIAERNNALAQRMQHQIAQTHKALRAIVARAEDADKPMRFDQMIAEGNEEGATLINAAIAELAKTTELIEDVAKTLGISKLSVN